MPRRIGREPACRLLELPAAPDLVATAVLVPGDDDVHEPLEEVPLVRDRRAPGVLERLVRLEVPARAREREAVGERLLDHRSAVLPCRPWRRSCCVGSTSSSGASSTRCSPVIT